MSRTPLNDFVLLHGAVEGCLRNDYVMLGKSPCNRLGHLGGRMDDAQILLVSFHTMRGTLARSDGRIVGDEVHVIMRSEIKFHKFGELSDCRRHIPMNAEVTEIQQGHTAVCMKRHSRLVSPEIRILVEVPVGAFRIILANIVPTFFALAFKFFPNHLEGIVILQILVRLMQLDRNISLSHLIVKDIKDGIDPGISFEQIS